MSFLFEAELFGRILISMLCGGLIGAERTNRGKGAGIRTHIIVAIASCLLMVLSQYGFEDFYKHFNHPELQNAIDPSRIAAQIVSGIGFLGAGMIFVQKNIVTGLTTAAGIWATAGIGMAIGCGMYFMGISCTILILVIHYVLHRYTKFIHTPVESEMEFTVEKIEDIEFLINTLRGYEISVINTEFIKSENGQIEVIFTTMLTENIDKSSLLQKISEKESIKYARI